jgi:hypothetical protein
LSATFEGVVSIAISSSNPLPSGLGEFSIILESEESFSSENLSFSIVSFIQAFILFLFALGLFYYGRVITHEVAQSKTTSHTLELRS